jgi:hypothetical protein
MILFELNGSMGVSRIEHFLVPYNEGGRWLRLPQKEIPE